MRHVISTHLQAELSEPPPAEGDGARAPLLARGGGSGELLDAALTKSDAMQRSLGLGLDLTEVL